MSQRAVEYCDKCAQRMSIYTKYRLFLSLIAPILSPTEKPQKHGELWITLSHFSCHYFLLLLLFLLVLSMAWANLEHWVTNCKFSNIVIPIHSFTIVSRTVANKWINLFTFFFRSTGDKSCARGAVVGRGGNGKWKTCQASLLLLLPLLPLLPSSSFFPKFGSAKRIQKVNARRRDVDNNFR